ncbi:MAG: metallophosphoesterase [Candidatus Sericytochromatia bacterium]
MKKKYNYIIGDIHGCFDELLELEEKILKHSEKHKVIPYIISCGDLVDRGHSSKEVLIHFFNGEKKGTHTSVIGNHELMMLQSFECFSKQKFKEKFPKYFETFKQMYKSNRGYLKNLSWETYKTTIKGIWLGQGGTETVQSFGLDPDDFSSWEIETEILDYILNMPVYYEDDNFIVTHALATKEDFDLFKDFNIQKDNLEIYPEEIIKSVNTLVWNRIPPEEAISKKLHISGHTPTKRVNRLRKANALQVDTGCVFGNRLTAYCPETKDIISIESKTRYK